MSDLIQVDKLCHEYEGGIAALRGISFAIGEQEFVAIVGANGSGKTTLVKHFNGLLKPTSGRVLINGEDTRRSKVSRLAEIIGFVFQNPDHQIFSYSVLEEVAFGLGQQGMDKEKASARALQALEVVGLATMAGRHPRELSLGQRQRLATASVLAMETPVLVLDEPTTGQDFLSRRQIMALAQELYRTGRTIIMVTHDMSLVSEYATRVIVMKDGRQVLDTDPHTLFMSPVVMEQARLIIPPVLQICLGLKESGLNGAPRTLDELCHSLMGLLSIRGLAP